MSEFFLKYLVFVKILKPKNFFCLSKVKRAEKVFEKKK